MNASQEFALDLDGRPVPVRVAVRADARRLKMAVVPGRGFRLTCPRAASRRAVAAFLEECRPWMARVLGQALPPDLELPSVLDFRGVGEAWELAWVARPGEPLRLRVNAGGRLLLAGDAADREACRGVLLRFVRGRAQALLPSRLAELAEATGLAPQRVVVRASRSRWGSCSAGGTIALSAFLLFVPPAALRYVLLHELCHLRRPDHSPAFWELVARFDPDHQRHRRLLGRMADHVPAGLL